MSLASDGDSSRVRALSLAAAIADEVVVFFGGVDSTWVAGAAASPVVFLGSEACACSDSAIASFSWAVFCDLMMRASFSCWASSRSSTLKASLSPAVFAAREKSAAALRCSSAASSQCTLSVSCAALRAWACAWTVSEISRHGCHASDRGLTLFTGAMSAIMAHTWRDETVVVSRDYGSSGA
jgi:hypothetical protein